MNKPLEGIKVLELARILAGPWAGQILADMGADVVKVERAGAGDDTRHWGPPFVTAADGSPHNSTYFNSCNRGKRSITADFETEEGRALIRELAVHADIVIENFKVGGLKKYGLDYPSLKALNPRLIWCSITGFGQDGPYAPRAGYDLMIQAMSGLMDITGDPAGPPMKAGNPPADLFTGVYSATGILAALFRRERTGEGAHLDMALLDTQVGVIGGQTLNYLVTGNVPRRMGNAHPSIVPYDVVPVAEGWAVLAVGNDRQFADFVTAIGLGELATDPRYVTNAQRVTHRATLLPTLAEKTRTLPRDELLALMEARAIPGGPINTIAEVFADPQVIHRGLHVDLADDGVAGGRVPVVRSPFVLDGEKLTATKAPPTLGADTEAVRADPAWGGCPA